MTPYHQWTRLNGQFFASGTINRGGTSGIRSEHLQSWLTAATREEQPDTANWDRVVEILHTAFQDVRLPTECTFQTVVIIPKGNGVFRSFSLIEVLWKVL